MPDVDQCLAGFLSHNVLFKRLKDVQKIESNIFT